MQIIAEYVIIHRQNKIEKRYGTMATKAKSFRIIEKKKAIVIYTNVEEIESEKPLIEIYLKAGYTPMIEEKKKGTTVAEMREEMKYDEKALADFNKAYGEKGGFHSACKVYTKWKGTAVDKMREEMKSDEKALANFNKAYKEKDGFHSACKVYNEWKEKNNKK